jgi:hypothetical protein
VVGCLSRAIFKKSTTNVLSAVVLFITDFALDKFYQFVYFSDKTTSGDFENLINN